MFVDEAVLKGSTHASLACVSCHRGATAPHDEKLSPVRCDGCHRSPPREVAHSVHAPLAGPAGGMACVKCHGGHGVQKAAAARPAMCATCHAREVRQLEASIHGTATTADRRGLPTCATCHGGGHVMKSPLDPSSPIHRSRIHETCATCHGNETRGAEQGITRPHAVALFEHSVHGRAIRERGNLTAATCTDCHDSHEVRRAADPASTVFRGRVAETCGGCHETEARQFQTSVHGRAVARGVFAAPNCTGCHGEHTIVATRDPASRVAPLAVSRTCAACHEATLVVDEFGLAAGRATTFFDSFHGLAVRGGSPVAANCASCHGTHDILPSSDPHSTINAANLALTCGRCHPGAGPQLVSARIHVGPGFGEHWLVGLVRKIYLVLIVATIGGMAAHNGLDYAARLRERWREQFGGAAPVHVPGEAADTAFERFTVNERLQHAVLLVAFTVLVITGFALKFPESWWARPLIQVEGGYRIRAWTHRGAGLLLCVASAYHLVYLLGTQRGRAQLRALAPRLRDVGDAVRMVAFNLGLRPARPWFDRFTYGEKLEYWAVVWGTAVMAATGFMMWFQSPAMSMSGSPLWILDLATVIHYYEAWLATLAIIVWHLYSVLFRADVYPMSWVWLTGRVSGTQMAEEHRAELERILRAGAAPADEAPASDKPDE